MRAPHVLVIDPHDDTRDMYAIGLESQGFQVSTGHDGADALEYARALQPAAIAMELSLPILDGLEVASLLNEDSSTNGIKLVAVTGSADLPTLRRALDAGFRSVLLKPCPPHELAAELHRALQPGGWSPRWFRRSMQRRRAPSAVRFGRAAMGVVCVAGYGDGRNRRYKTVPLFAIYQGRRYLAVSQTAHRVWLQSTDTAATRVNVAANDRDLILNPTEADLELAAAYERGEINAFEYPDGHTYPANRETGPFENGDDADEIH